MALIELINDKKVRIFDKEESLLEVEKLLTRLLSEYDNNTEEMVQKLHQARDKQVCLINLRFVGHMNLYRISTAFKSLKSGNKSGNLKSCLLTILGLFNKVIVEPKAEG